MKNKIIQNLEKKGLITNSGCIDNSKWRRENREQLRATQITSLAILRHIRNVNIFSREELALAIGMEIKTFNNCLRSKSLFSWDQIFILEKLIGFELKTNKL